MFGALSATAYASDFGTFQHDNYHTGVTTDSAPTVTPTANWATYGDSYYGYAGFDVAPVVGGDKMFEVSYNGTIFAFNKTTGAIAWINSLLSGNGTFELATPVYNNGVLYVALSNTYYDSVTYAPICTNTSISAINANDGTIVWTEQVPMVDGNYFQTDSPVVFDSGNVYFGTANVTPAYTTDNGVYYCYNATTGAQVWSLPSMTESGYYWAGAAVIGDYLVYGDDSGILLSVNKNTGSIVDSFDVSDGFGVPAGKLESSISYNRTNSSIYFTSTGGYCFNLGFNNATGFFGSTIWNAQLTGASTSTPAVYDGKVFVGTNSNSLVCLYATNGSSFWSVNTNGPVQSSPVVSAPPASSSAVKNYHVYFTTNTLNGTVYCVNATGNTSWTYLPPSGMNQYTLQGVAISNGSVYFGNDAGYVFGLKQ